MTRSIQPPPSMTPPHPRVRGRYMKTFAEHIANLPAEDREAIHDAVPEQTWRDIDEANMFAWLSFEVNLMCTRAVAERLGPKRAHDFFLNLLGSTFETPLLKSLVDAVVRLNGTDPSVMLGWVSKGFEIMFKDSGSWSVSDREEGAACLEVTGLPAVAVADRVWVQSVASSLSALFTVAKVAGATTIREVDGAKGRVVYRLRWDQRT